MKNKNEMLSMIKKLSKPKIELNKDHFKTKLKKSKIKKNKIVPYIHVDN